MNNSVSKQNLKNVNVSNLGNYSVVQQNLYPDNNSMMMNNVGNVAMTNQVPVQSNNNRVLSNTRNSISGGVSTNKSIVNSNKMLYTNSSVNVE